MPGSSPALEQRAEDRRIDLRPVEVRRRQYRLDVSGLQRERRTVVEQSAVEPGDRLEANPAAGGHHSEELGGQLGELLRGALRLSQHPGEHVIGQQAHVVGEHAEDEAVDEMRDHGRIVATRPQRLGDGREGALVHGSELRDRSPVPREGVTPLGNCRACRAGSSC